MMFPELGASPSRNRKLFLVFPVAGCQQKDNSSIHDGKEKKRKLFQQMMAAGATTRGIVRWRWGQVHEYRNGLMRPEITHYLVKITAELVEILGVELEETKE